MPPPADSPAEAPPPAGLADARAPTPSGLPTATPVMAQYWALKRAHPDCLLFFRMGDFYELFFDDAASAAAALDIALTRRGRHLGEDIPMCGVPAASHETYLARLIRKGFKVAVCEQLEAPAEARRRGGKAVVARDVVRIVTPGTLTEDTLLDARRPNHLAALALVGDGLGLAWVDISTGQPASEAPPATALAAALARIDPGELLVAEPLAQRPALKPVLADWRPRLTLLPAARFDAKNGERRLRQLYGVDAAGFGAFEPAETAALAGLLDYIDLTQKGKLPRLAPPVRLADASLLQIDAATRRNLELSTGAGGERAGSLLAVIDRTITAMGARRLAARLATPLADPGAIDRRLDAVQALVDDPPLRRRLRTALKRCPDLERALSRLSVGRGGPRDLAQIRDGLAAAAALAAEFEAVAAAAGPLPAALGEATGQLADPAGDGGRLHADLARALAETLPAAVRDGGLIAAGHDPALDVLRQLRDDSRRLILDLEARYAAETGLAQLRIRHNTLLGYFVEVPQRLADRVPVGAAGPFIQRQSMASAVRFQTVELADLERRIARAADDALAREAALFEALAAAVLAAADAIARAAAAIARVDVAQGLAETAQALRHVRPVVDAGADLAIEGGRHPVVESRLRAEGGGSFVGNDCRLGSGDAARLWLLTGPNMAGKSTFLRQTALIVVLAQIGAFVPADRARIGVVDRLFSRVGAADDLARGRSTFMVEMVETAAILAEAGPRSFVILDEVGRGTATFDGLAIAWAVVEHLAERNRCRGLIATHYHELTALAARLPALACQTMRTKEWQGDVVFLHEVVPGVADRSYGVHVARLAGLPPPVIRRAREILALLETGEPTSALARLACDLPLFAAALARPAAAPPPAAPAAADPAAALVADVLATADPDRLTPREALDLVYRLKAMLSGDPAVDGDAEAMIR